MRGLARHMKSDRLGGQAVLSFALKIVTAVASFGLNWLIARRFGPSGTGLYGIAMTTFVLTTYFVIMAQDYIVVRNVAGDMREGKTSEAGGVVRMAALYVGVSGLLTTLFVWLARDWIAAHILHQPAVAQVLAVMFLAVIPLSLMRVVSAALRASGALAWSQVIDGPLGGVLALAGFGGALLCGLADDVHVAAWAFTIGAAIACGAGWLRFRRIAAAWPAPIRPPLWPMLMAGIPITASILSNQFTEWYTTVMLGAHWDPATVGQYRVAWQFVALLGLVQASMDSILGPRIAGAWRAGDKAAIARVSHGGMALMLLLASPLLIIILVAPHALLGLFGPGFEGGALALQVLAVGQVIRLASGPVGTILMMTGHERWTFLYAAIGVALTALTGWLLIPRYGVLGAALATAITVSFRNLAAAVVVQRVIGIKLVSLPRRG